MTPPKIVVTRPLPDLGSVELHRAVDAGLITVVQQQKDEPADRTWLVEQLGKGDVAGLVCMLGDNIDEQVIESAGPSLKVVSTMSAGYDHVDTRALKARGIRLGTTPDALTDATADIGAMLTLMASRRAGEAMRAVLDDKWPSMPWSPLLLCGAGLQSRTVGILGFGKIGQLTLKRLLGFGIGRALYTTSRPGSRPKVDYFKILDNKTYDTSIEPASSLEHLARESDVVIVCCALTSETRHLVSTEFLSWMKPTSYLVNTARGPIVDTAALVRAVRQGQIAGAGLDVVEGEPNIRADDDVVKEQKIIVLPHIGSATLETRNEMARQAAVNCVAGVLADEEARNQGYTWANEVEL
ncbi:hypothetical protein ACM66B_003215 [Microbotryomycetes sp. NB124-2]